MSRRALFTEHQCDITGIATRLVPLVYQKESTWLSGRACMSSWYCCPTIGAPCTAPRNWAARLAVQHLECWETSLRLELLTNEILKSLTIDASRKQQRFLPKLWHMSECRSNDLVYQELAWTKRNSINRTWEKIRGPQSSKTKTNVQNTTLRICNWVTNRQWRSYWGNSTRTTSRPEQASDICHSTETKPVRVTGHTWVTSWTQRSPRKWIPIWRGT